MSIASGRPGTPGRFGTDQEEWTDARTGPRGRRRLRPTGDRLGLGPSGACRRPGPAQHLLPLDAPPAPAPGDLSVLHTPAPQPRPLRDARVSASPASGCPGRLAGVGLPPVGVVARAAGAPARPGGWRWETSS